MWNIEYRDANGKGFSDTEPWIEEGIETEDELNTILDSMKCRGCIDIKVIDLNNLGCDCCSGDEAIFWKDDKNNAFVDSKGEISITANGEIINFRVQFCPCCGKKF